MDDLENQSNWKTFSDSEHKTNSSDAEGGQVFSLCDANETERRSSRPSEMADNTDFCAKDDSKSIGVEPELDRFGECEPGTSQISENNENFSSMDTSNESAECNLVPDSDFFQMHGDNLIRNRPSGFSASVSRYTSQHPSTLSSIPGWESNSSEFHGSKKRISDYIIQFVSTFVKQNEFDSSNCIDVSSNLENRDTTDVMNPEETVIEKSDSVGECPVDDPRGCPAPSLSKLNRTNNPESLNEFKSNSIAKQNSVVDRDRKRFICNKCPKGFKRKANLTTHMFFIHEEVKPFKCGMYGKMFIQEVSLRAHIRVHTDEKPFVCDVCGKSFTRKGNLQTYIGIHNALKPFECETCGKLFTQKGNLNSHSFTHPGEKPFTCELRGKIFKSKRGLSYHMKYVPHLRKKSRGKRN